MMLNVNKMKFKDDELNKNKVKTAKKLGRLIESQRTYV